MTIATKLKALATRPSVSNIGAQLAEAQRQLVALENEHEAAALAALSDEDGDKDRLARATQTVADARQRVVNLRGAIAAAQRDDEDKQAAARAVAHASQIAAVKSHLNARNKLALQLAADLKNAVATWKSLIEASRKAEAAAPAGHWPPASLCDFGSLRQAVAHELHRLSGPTDLTRLHASFPGAQAPTMGMAFQPDAVQPLSETIAAASKYVLATLTGKPLPAAEAPSLEPAPEPRGEIIPDGPRRSADEIIAALPKVRMA